MSPEVAPPQLPDLLAQLATLTATVQQLSDSRRVDADDGPTKEAVMCRVSKPYKNRDKWRVRVTDTETGATRNHIYDTEAEAIAAKPKLLREYRRPVGVPLDGALIAYDVYLRAKGNKPRAYETTIQRLRAVFKPALQIVTGDLTASRMLALWGAWEEDKATATRRSVLNETRTFLAWLEKKEWTKRGSAEVTGKIEVIGKPNKGKPKLSQDEAQQLLAWCLAHPDDQEAIATAMAFVLGMRASEIVTRTVRHLDGKGTLLRITDAKTEAGERTLKLPAVLQPLLAKLVEGKEPDALIFGGQTRYWVLRAVKRCCKEAGVRVITAHGLRGMHAMIAREVGVSGVLLAQAMGHESESTTTNHYAGKAAVANAGINRVAELGQLSPGLTPVRTLRPHFVPGMSPEKRQQIERRN
jgi:integrase